MSVKLTFDCPDLDIAKGLIESYKAALRVEKVASAITEEIAGSGKTAMVPEKTAHAKKSRKKKKVDPVTDARQENDSDVDMDDLRQALLTLGSTHDLGMCADALSRVGAKKLSEVNPSKFGELHKILLTATETGDV